MFYASGVFEPEALNKGKVCEIVEQTTYIAVSRY